MTIAGENNKASLAGGLLVRIENVYCETPTACAPPVCGVEVAVFDTK